MVASMETGTMVAPHVRRVIVRGRTVHIIDVTKITKADPKEAMSGDNYKREFTDDVASCGCRWELRKDDPLVSGWVLVECPIHKQATKASLAKFDRER